MSYIRMLQVGLLLAASCCEGGQVANAVKLMISALDRPVRITAMVCWSREMALDFLKSLREQSHLPTEYLLAIARDDFAFFPTALDEHHEMIILDLSCNSSADLLNQSAIKLSMHYTWLILTTNAQQSLAAMETELLETLENSPILPRSEIFYIYSDRLSEVHFIKQLYRAAMLEPIIIEMFGIIANDSFIDQRVTSITSRRRQDLRGIKIEASMVITNNDTLNHLTDYRDQHIDPITKVNYVLTEHLMRYVNANANYSIVYSWGYRNDTTGEWSGMVGQLVRNEAEIGSSPLFMTIDRVSLIQYIAMPTPTGSRFVFRSPKLSFTDNVFLLPFDNLVWCCLIGLVIVTASCLMIAVLLEWKYSMLEGDKKLKLEDSSLLHPSIGDVFLLIYGATCQQGSAVAPRSVTARIIMVLAFTILMFLYTSYSANIVALLQSPSNKIKTLEDLYTSRLEIGVDDTVFNRYYFTHAKDPIRKGIYEKKVLRKDGQSNYMSLGDGVHRMRAGLFAFHMELGIGYKVMSETFYEDEKCGLREIKFLQVTNPWYAIRKNSSYLELFKTGMIRMHEHGLQDRENSRLYTKKPKCTGGGGNFITASLVDTRPAMLVLLWGIAFAIKILLCEMFINYLKHRKSNKAI